MSAYTKLLVVLALMATGCGSTQRSDHSPSPAPDASETSLEASPVVVDARNGNPTLARAPKLAFVTNNSSVYWKMAVAGVDAYEKEAGVAVDVKMPVSGEASEQNQILGRLVGEGYDGIALSVIDPKGQVALLDRVAASAKLVTFDSDAPASKRVLYVGTDNVAAGKTLGEAIAKLLPRGGKIALFVGVLASENATQRIAGLRAAIAGKKLQIVASKEDFVDREKALTNVEDAVKEHPDIDLLVGLWSYNGPAIASFLAARGPKSSMKGAAFDEEEGTLDAIASGVLAFTVVQKPFQFGYLSSRWIHELATKPQAEAALPRTRAIDTGVEVIDRTNIRELQARVHDLLR